MCEGDLELRDQRLVPPGGGGSTSGDPYGASLRLDEAANPVRHPDPGEGDRCVLAIWPVADKVYLLACELPIVHAGDALLRVADNDLRRPTRCRAVAQDDFRRLGEDRVPCSRQLVLGELEEAVDDVYDA